MIDESGLMSTPSQSDRPLRARQAMIDESGLVSSLSQPYPARAPLDRRRHRAIADAAPRATARWRDIATSRHRDDG
jgi:hypothetical protein